MSEVYLCIPHLICAKAYTVALNYPSHHCVVLRSYRMRICFNGIIDSIVISVRIVVYFIAFAIYRSVSGTGMQMQFWMLDSEDAIALVERISQACDEAKRKRTARMEGTAERQAEVTCSF